jgi:hypothetical protein
MSAVLDVGQRLVVVFLGLCSALGALNVVRGLVAWSKWGLIFGLAQGVFALLAGAAAWNIYKWKVAGWVIGLLVVLDWLSALVNSRIGYNWLTIVLTFPMAAAGIWLWFPEVRTKFGMKKVFS